MRDEYILERLMQGGAVSGEALSREMELSRAAVWKGVLRLREAGWHIEAAPRVGYRLIPGGDELLPMCIYDGLNTKRYGRAAEYHREIGSTNARAKELALSGARDGTLVVAEAQTAGRGRLSRSWQSPQGAGIYMSLIMRPELPMQSMALITPAVALGVCRGLSALCDDAVRIKWPNDIVCSGRKLVGILLDAQASTGASGVEWVVAGIGINVHQHMEDLPEDIRDKAGSLDMATGRINSRARTVQLVLAEIERAMDMLMSGREDELMAEYAAMSATLGKRVRVIGMGGEYEAEALRLRPDGALIVRAEDGQERAVYAGDVSVRGIMGYV